MSMKKKRRKTFNSKVNEKNQDMWQSLCEKKEEMYTKDLFCYPEGAMKLGNHQSVNKSQTNFNLRWFIIMRLIILKKKHYWCKLSFLTIIILVATNKNIIMSKWNDKKNWNGKYKNKLYKEKKNKKQTKQTKQTNKTLYH